MIRIIFIQMCLNPDALVAHIKVSLVSLAGHHATTTSESE